MKSYEVWSRIKAAKQTIRRELVALSQDIGPEFDIDVKVEWATSGSSERGVSSRAPKVEVSVLMGTTSGGPFYWADLGSEE